MSVRHALVLGVLFVLLGGLVVPSAAPVEFQVVVTGSTYYPGDDGQTQKVGDSVLPVLVITQGSGLALTNLDVSFNSHSLTSDDYEPDGVTYIFDTGTTLVNVRQTAVVQGISKLAPGVYGFHCRQIGHGMRGYLRII